MNLDYLTLRYFVFPLGIVVDAGLVACVNPAIPYDLVPKPGRKVSVTVVGGLHLTLFLPPPPLSFQPNVDVSSSIVNTMDFASTQTQVDSGLVLGSVLWARNQ